VTFNHLNNSVQMVRCSCFH